MYSNIQRASNSRKPPIIIKKRAAMLIKERICGPLNKRSTSYLYYCTKENAKKRKKTVRIALTEKRYKTIIVMIFV